MDRTSDTPAAPAQRSEPPSARVADLLELFHSEALEQLAVIEADLATIEADPATLAEGLGRALRAAHGLKGGASVVDLGRVEGWMHNWEACAGALARGEIAPTSAVMDALFQVLDVVASEVERGCGAGGSRRVQPPSLQDLRRIFGPGVVLVDLPAALGAREDAPVKAPIVRVPLARIEALTADIEGLMQAKADAERLANLAAEIELATDARSGALGVGAREHARHVEGLAHRLGDAVRALRMIPSAAVFGALGRAVRDAARASSKRARLAVIGGDTEIDRDLAEALREPVLHLLRNAIAHGIEDPATRAAAGKPPEGRVSLEVATKIGGLEVRVTDDGRGIDRDRLVAAARARGLLTDDEAQRATDADALRLVFAPGLSTAEKADALSGRGVGLDAVRESIERCGGTISLSSAPGAGTTCTLELPLSLSSMRVLVARAGAETIAFPTSAVAHVARAYRHEVRASASGPAIEIEGRHTPVLVAAELFGARASGLDEARDRLSVLVLASGNQRAAVVVDALEGQEDVVVKSLGRFFPRVPNVSGVAVTAGGRVLPLASVTDLLVCLRVARPVSARVAKVDAPARRVLVVDDSITTRTLEKGILEAAGFVVDTAADGVQAFEKLRAARFDLVVSDVQMPRMDGIELAERIAREAAFGGIPVVLVSSLGDPDDRRRGLVAGAAAYIGKAEFKQSLLLETIERLLS